MSSNYQRRSKSPKDFSSGKGKNERRRESSLNFSKGSKDQWKRKSPKTRGDSWEHLYNNKKESSQSEKTRVGNQRFSSQVESKNRNNSKTSWGKNKTNQEQFSRRNSSGEIPQRARQSRHLSAGNNKYQNSSNQGFLNKEFPENYVFEKETDDVFWGRHSIQSILESGRPVHRIWCTSEVRSSPRFFQLLKDAKSLGVLVEEVSWARLAHVTSGGVHQGIALQTAASESLDLDTLLDACSKIEENPVLIALDGLTDPHNIGAIVRSAEALGAHGIILPQRRSAGLTGSAAKAAAGALEHLPVARVVNLNRSLEKLKESGYNIIGLAGEGDKTLNKTSLEGALVLVIGSEDRGLSLLTRRHCDQLIRIPLRGMTSSLNASVATSVFLYEIARQGWMKSLSGQDPSPKLSKAKLITKPIE